MSITSVSNLSRTLALTTALQTEQSALTQLSSQLSSEKKYTDLTDYGASDARNLVNLQATATQKQAYLNVINTASNTLSIYDTTLTDLENITSQAQTLANDNPSYSTTGAMNVKIQAADYLKSITVDFNQVINGRYLFSGSRYNTPPVQDLSALPSSTLTSTVETDGLTVPVYDTSSTLSLSVSSQNIAISGSANGNAGSQTAEISLNGTMYSLVVSSSDSTPSAVATDLATQLANNYGLPVTADTTDPSNPVLVIDPSMTIDSAQVATTDTSAYTTDQAVVDTNYDVHYGITSNDPSFQTLIAGLRYLQAAGNATNSTTYQADVSKAGTLLTSALTQIQTLHTGVANNINVMKSEKNAQNSAILSLTTQVNDIQQVDITQVSTEMTTLETILQASYSATGSLLKLSIVNYL